MKRTIVKRLAAALHRPAHSQWLVASCLLRLPPAQAATAEVWSPGPGYLEARTALVWALPAGGTTVRAVVGWTDTDGEMLAEADVAVEDVLGLGGLTDKPTGSVGRRKPGRFV